MEHVESFACDSTYGLTPNLKQIKQRCQQGGQDRVKIAHIRDIEIDGDVIVLEQI